MALGINKGNADRQYQQNVRLLISVPSDSAGSHQHWPGNRRGGKDQECESEVSIRQGFSPMMFGFRSRSVSRRHFGTASGLHSNTQSRGWLDCAIQVSSLDGGAVE